MADAILYGVVQKIIESLGSSTLKQIGSIWGVKDDLEKMKETVLAIQAVLEDAEEQQVKNHQVKDWLMKLRDVVFDADDLLSEFNTRVLRQKVMGGDKIVKKVRIFFSGSNPFFFGLEMARKIKVMRERINDIARDRNNFQLVERPLLVTRTVTMGRVVQSAMSDYVNWVSNGTILDAPVSIFSLFPAYESETDVSSVFNDSPPRFSHSNFIMSIYAPARSETDSSENYEIIPNPSIMSIFSPARSETGSLLSIGSTHSIPLLFPANKSETDSGSESNETPPPFSYPMMSIFPSNRSQTDNSGNYEIIPTDPSIPPLGREEDKKAIIGVLLDFDVKDDVSFISIVGIGGLGKTTLAQYVFNDDEGTNKESTLKKLISTFRYLRALDLHGLNMKMLPKTIGTLMHLKYLDLFSNDIEVLPSSITKLVNLQTLKLCKLKKLRELPVDIQKLVSLKHLDLEDCENLTHMPHGLGQLTSLQTLNLFVLSEGPVGSSKHFIYV